MKIAGNLFVAFLVLGLIASMAKVVVLVLVGMVILALVSNPRETFGSLAGLAVLGLCGQHPLAMIALAIVMLIFAINAQGQEPI